MLQRVAACFSVLQCVAACCSVLYVMYLVPRGPAQSEYAHDSRFDGPRTLGAAVRCEHFKQEHGPKPELAPSPFLSP